MAQVRRVFLDANILFTAAHRPQGLAFGLIERSASLKLEIVTSDYAYEEARYNLALKFPDSVPILEKLKNQMRLVQVSVDENQNPLDLPLDDLPIFQAALASGSQFLISGDKKAFGKWMGKPEKTGGIVLSTLREFVDQIFIK